MTSWPPMPPQTYDDIYPSVMAGNSLDGKNFSFPGVVHPGGNISVNFNKTLLEEKGIPLAGCGLDILRVDRNCQGCS